MSYPFLSIITEPPPTKVGKKAIVKGFVLRFLRLFLKGRVLPGLKKYGGHNAVTRSLMEGLEKIGATFNYIPTKDKMHDNVIVLSGVEKLKEVLTLKKEGKFKLLLVGPNIVDHVLDHANIVADPLIDFFVVPSEWVKKIVLDDCPALENRIMIWPAGVNSKFWVPKKRMGKKVLVYKKTETKEFHQNVVMLLNNFGFEADEIEYGNYDEAYFKLKLEKSAFAIFISRSESQGMALTEAWSMNIPTLVYNPGDFVYAGKLVTGISACPFINAEVGREWKTIEELSKLLKAMKQKKLSFSPRKFVLNNFTDEKCARDLLHKIEICRQNIF